MARNEVIAYAKEIFGTIGGAAVAGNIEIETGGLSFILIFIIYYFTDI